MYVCATLLIWLAASDASPLYQLVGYYVTTPFGYPLHPVVYTGKPQILHHRAHADTPSPLITNTITYTTDPDADPDDALEVAQFHSQDAAGRVIFGFNTPTQARMEARSVDGTVRGSYSYVDPLGKTVRMQYWDDGTGFHTSGTTGPGRIFDEQSPFTPEVQAARDQHFRMYEQALLAAAASGPEHDDPYRAYFPVRPTDSSVNAGQKQSSATHEDESNDSVSIENPDYLSFQVGPVRKPEPEGQADGGIKLEKEDTDLAIVTNVEQNGNSYQYSVPVPDPVNGRSESLHATLYGAIPVAAVHDSQVSPSQKDKVPNHQLLPVLLKTRPSVESS